MAHYRPGYKPKSQINNGLTQNDIHAVVSNLQTQLGHNLVESQIRYVMNEIIKINRRYMEQYGKQWVLDQLATDLFNYFTSSYPPRALNMHEVQVERIGNTSEDTSVYMGSHIRDDGDPIIREEEKKMDISTTKVIDIDNLFGFNTSYNIREIFNPAANLSNVYLNIDTKYRVLEASMGNSLKEFSFNINHEDKIFQGNINVIGYVRNIVQMEIAPFRIPKTADKAVTNEILQYRRATLRIHEFDSQSVIGHENRHYHFEFVMNDDDNRFYDLVPLPNTAARFRFRKPITTLSSLTLSFGTPMQVLLFDKDRIVFTIALTVAGILTFTTVSGVHNLQAGDLVYMEKFNTDDTIADSILIQEMNRSRGHIIENVADTTFDIDIGVIGLNDPVGNIIPVNGIELYLGSKRILFKIRLTYITPLDENED